MSAWRRKARIVAGGLPPDPDCRPAHPNPERQLLKDVFGCLWCKEFSNSEQVRFPRILEIVIGFAVLIAASIAAKQRVEGYLVPGLVVFWWAGFLRPFGSNLLVRAAASSIEQRSRGSLLSAAAVLPARPAKVLRSVFLHGLVMMGFLVMISCSASVLHIALISQIPMTPHTIDSVFWLGSASACLFTPLLVAAANTALAAGDVELGGVCAACAAALWPLTRLGKNALTTLDVNPWTSDAAFAVLTLALVASVVFKHLRSGAKRTS